MPQHKDFSGWITIEDKKADEFNVEVSDDGNSLPKAESTTVEPPRLRIACLTTGSA
jgi:hypothetical protein